MNCPRGKASPDTFTKFRLFAASAGYCQNPVCLQPLFEDTGTKVIHIAEMAHVFSASDYGPRAKRALSKEERGAFGNLILLCANCHTRIDKAEHDYPDELILEWKRNHELQLERLFNFITYESRSEARRFIEPIFRENRTIFVTYGPLGEQRFNPESDLPAIWVRKIRNAILPNNRRILAILEKNQIHMTESELSTFEIYRQHVNDFETRHVGEPEVGGIRFPREISNIFKDSHER